MKKILFLVLLVVLVTVGGYYWKSSRPRSIPKGKIKVVVSGYVPYTLAKQLAGDRLDLEMLLPPGAEPHGFEPAPGSLVSVHRADAFFYVSDRLEPWVKDVLGAVGPNTRVVMLASAVSDETDPHVWMNFDAVRAMAHTLAQSFGELDPAHAPVYLQNLERFETEIKELDKKFSQTLASCESREMVHIGHLAFGALARRYQLELTSLTGSSHDGEHSVRRLAGLVKHIRKRKIHALFTEEAVSPRLAQAVAVETGTEILPLYTIEHVSKTDFNQSVTYRELMLRNLDNLQRGLVCKK